LKTRYSSLVAIKKNEMQKQERVLQEANATLTKAKKELENSFLQLQKITQPLQGNMSELLSTRHLLDTQRKLIQHNEEWVAYAQKEVYMAQEALKKAMVEYEKFKYLELQEIETIVAKAKREESKSLDEIALMTFRQKQTQVATL